MLLHGGATVDECDEQGQQGIHWVCQTDNYECLNVLIKYGADVNRRSGKRSAYYRKAAQDRAHWLPIEYAIVCDSPRCICCLIDAGAQLWGPMFQPQPWIIDYANHIAILRKIITLLLVSHKQSILQSMDYNIVKMICKKVWELRGLLF